MDIHILREPFSRLDYGDLDIIFSVSRILDLCQIKAGLHDIEETVSSFEFNLQYRIVDGKRNGAD